MYQIVMQEKTLAIVAMIGALGLTGVIVVETLIISQQVNAVIKLQQNGCTPDKQGFTASDGKCSHGIITNTTNGRSFHP